jgi:hypothetical protein
MDKEPGSQSMPSLLTLDELRPEAAPMKGSGCGQACYTSTDDQDRFYLCHGCHHSRCTNRRVPRLRRVAGSGIADLGFDGTVIGTKVKSCDNPPCCRPHPAK